MEVQDLELLAWRLFEESNDAVFLLDDSEQIWQANPAAQRLTGLPWRQLRGRRLDELVQSDHEGPMVRLFSAIRETGFFHSQEEYFLYRHLQDPLPINISVSRVHAGTDHVGLVVARDISERKQAEQTLQRFNNQLHEQVSHRTAQLRDINRRLVAEIKQRKIVQNQLRDTNQQLRSAIAELERAREHAIRRERLHALEQIAGGIAHDVNNSLVTVTTFSELILSRDLDNETRQWTEGIRTAATDMATTIRRLREFYVERADQEARDIDLVELAREVIQLTRPKWHDESLRQGKEIVVSLASESAPQIVGDASAIRSALTNLIFNAADAIEGSGEITISVAEQGGMAALEVIDNGTGMTEDARRCCLEPFYTSKAEGTGLGLSVCHGIIKSHGGQVQIDSAIGKGTVVRLLVPKPSLSPLSCAPAGKTETRPLAPNELQEKRVLYIDDNQAARSSTKAFLKSLGMVVDTATDGRSGLTMFRESAYDIVITDMSMPGMDGLQVTREIKRIVPAQPVAIVSGWLVTDASKIPTGAEPDGVLSKPFSPEELSAILTRLLRT